MFTLKMLMTVLVAVLISGVESFSRQEACAPECRCIRSIMICSNQGLKELPHGVWSNIKYLDVSQNAISDIDNLGRNFPALVYLRMRENTMTTLHLNNIAGLSAPLSLSVVDLSHNAISKVYPVPPGRVNQLATLFLTSNKIENLHRDIFAALPNLKNLALNDNPLVLPKDQPFMVQPILKEMDLSGVDASALSEKSFAEMPSLLHLGMHGSRVRNVSGLFTNLQNLQTLYLDRNVITEISTRSPVSRTLTRLSLDHNPLISINPDALPIKDGGELIIEDTPISCACGHKEVVSWALQHRVDIFADCQGVSNCEL